MPFHAWLDGIDAGWAIPLLIAAFAGLWLLFLIIAYLGGDLHVDALEAWSVGRSFAWGNAKHPPLMGWMAHLWTLVFPTTDWSIQLLAMTNAAVALWAVDLIARRFVSGDKRALVLLLLMLLPAYQFHAQRFNANSVLLAVWPLATYCFLRSFQSRAVDWAVAAGALTAVAMLGKYYSVFLVGGFVFAALAHPQRRAYFRSPAPWVSAGVGLLALAPHLYWLATTGAEPFEYAIRVHGGMGWTASAGEVAMFVLGLAATLALPALAWVLITQGRLKRLPAELRALDPGLLLLALIGVGTLVLPMIAAIAAGIDMPSLWALQGLFLIIVVIVCGASFPIERFHTVNLAVSVLGMAVVAITLGAPAHAIYRNAYGPNERGYYRLAALELTRRWHELSELPLPAVSGEDALAFATAFYSPDHPVYRRPFQYRYTWGLPRRRTLEKGWAAMCFVDHKECMHWASSVTAIAPQYQRFDFVVTPTLWGQAGVPATIAALMVLPLDTPPPDHGIAPSSDGVEDFSASRRPM